MFKGLKDLYDCLEDEESKMIFRYRLLYGLTEDLEYIKKMLVHYRKENKGFYDILDVLAYPDAFSKKEIILFGTGFWGPCVDRWLKHCKLESLYFCDNDIKKIGQQFLGKRIISPKELFADNIIRYVRGMNKKRGSEFKTLYRLVGNKVEASEFLIAKETKYTSIPLKDLNLRKNVLLACIIRSGKVIIPNGNDTLEPLDSLIVVTSDFIVNDLIDIME